MSRGAVALLLSLAFAVPSFAHVGSPNSVYEGNAGPYPIRVIVRVPPVVPGLAEITVRTSTPGITRVSVKPVKWDAGSAGSPPPDEAKHVSGDANLYSANLWLMAHGAYKIDVEVEGGSGTGHTVVPVNAVATARLPMPRALGIVLALMAGLLAAGIVSIVGAGVREAVVEPGQGPDPKRRRRAQIAMGVCTVVVVLAATQGNAWWKSVDATYRQWMYKPFKVTTRIDGNVLDLVIHVNERRTSDGRWTPLVPDHGKLMHLFLVADPSRQLLAHLHPLSIDRDHFRGTLPPLPPGDYRLFADVTHESGFAETLVDRIHIAAPPPPAPPSDADDSVASASDTSIVLQSPRKARANSDTTLEFAVNGGTIEPYMGMAGHAVIVASDFSVFAHIHPMGTVSMAAMPMAMGANGNAISFPYVFPKAGRYRVFVQTRVNGKVVGGAYDIDVSA